MATPAAGVTVSWDSVAFREVVELKFTHGAGLPISRQGTPFAVDMGSIDISCLGTANISVANYGKRRTFQIAGQGFAFTHKAIWEKVNVEKKTNDVERYVVTLKFAPS
ncbi:MAG: hypothetical protein EB117_14395 [Betaproteobacteria bacterium]|nr:hypothetical protein [Betaproteobacteria bacterium]